MSSFPPLLLEAWNIQSCLSAKHSILSHVLWISVARYEGCPIYSLVMWLCILAIAIKVSDDDSLSDLVQISCPGQKDKQGFLFLNQASLLV